MFYKNLIKATALCLTFFALLSASAIAQKQDDSPKVSGATIPGVSINVKKKSGGNIVATTKTDGDGNFSFTLPPGDYILEVISSQSNTASTIAGKHSPELMNRESAAAQTDKKNVKWISAKGSGYKFSIEGDGLTVGEASLIEDSTTDAELSKVGKTKYNEKTNESSRKIEGEGAAAKTSYNQKTNVATRVSITIEDKDVQKGAAVKIRGTVMTAQ
jgi:hypothetical protein